MNQETRKDFDELLRELAYCFFKAASFHQGAMSPGELGIQQEEFAKKRDFEFHAADAILNQMSEEEVGRVYILFAENANTSEMILRFLLQRKRSESKGQLLGKCVGFELTGEEVRRAISRNVFTSDRLKEMIRRIEKRMVGGMADADLSKIRDVAQMSLQGWYFSA